MTHETARVVRFYKTGDATVLKLETLPKREPAAGEVRIAVEAIGLNRAEIMFREGQYLEAPSLPSSLGYEASGVIEATGPGVQELKTGDRVSTIPAFSMTEYGVYGESVVVPVHAVSRYPENLSATEGTSIWMQYLTAYGALVEIGGIKHGGDVLITAASSSVGVAAIQIANYLGARTIVTTRTPAKQAFLKQTGADEIIITDEEDLSERVMQITEGKGVEVVFDPIAGPMLDVLAGASAQGATIIEYGALASESTPYPLFPALAKGLSIRGYTLFEVTQDVQRLQKGKDFIYKGLAEKALVPVIDKSFPLEEIVEAHRYLETNQQCGKIVVTV